jgi:hypothetical protein
MKKLLAAPFATVGVTMLPDVAQTAEEKDEMKK